GPGRVAPTPTAPPGASPSIPMAGWRGRRRIDQLAGLVRYGGCLWGPEVVPGSGRRGEAEVLFVGPGLSRPTVVGPIPQPEPSSAGRHKADPTGCPAGEPSGRSRQRAPGVAEVLFVGPGSSRPTAVGPTRQLEPGPAGRHKAGPTG